MATLLRFWQKHLLHKETKPLACVRDAFTLFQRCAQKQLIVAWVDLAACCTAVWYTFLHSGFTIDKLTSFC